MRKKWSDEEKDFVKKFRKDLTAQQIADKLNRSLSSVTSFLQTEKRREEKNDESRSKHKRMFTGTAICKCCKNSFRKSNKNYVLCSVCYTENPNINANNDIYVYVYSGGGLDQEDAAEVKKQLDLKNKALRDKICSEVKTIPPEQHIKDMQRLFPGNKVYAPITDSIA